MNESDIKKLIEIAKGAGEILLKYFDKKVITEYKSDQSPVTIADKESNLYIVTRLKEYFPDFGVISEEAIGDWKDYTWVVDPLDGTKSFLNHDSTFYIQIGLLHKNEPIFGLSYNPIVEEVYYGGKEIGAFFVDKNENETKLEITNRLPINQNNIIVFRSINLEGNKKEFKSIISTIKATDEYLQTPRHSFIWLARGEANLKLGIANHEFGIWDVCATQAILEGAGGVVTDKYGKKLIYEDGKLTFSSFIAADCIERIKNLPWVPK
jgi:3'-phosphoadenosine 5'-phosphosulfate (PAPS) 3'-phosphatase